MKLNRKGQTGLEIPVSVYIIAGIMAAITGLGLFKTAVNGVLVNNMKVIGCKVANKGEKYCNEKYDYTPKVEETVKTGGGLRKRILNWQK